MAVTKVNARGFTFEIQTKGGSPTWTEIGGITSWSPEFSDEETDTTDFDSAGLAESEVMQRGKAFTIEGFFKEDTANGNRDAGQEVVEEAAEDIGADSLWSVRITTPGGTVRTWTNATVMLTGGGGGNNDKASWGAKFTRSGGETVS